MSYQLFTSLRDWQYDTGPKKLKHVPVSGVTVVAATDLFSSTGHGLVSGIPVIFSTTGTLPAGLALNTTYYVIASGLTANDFRVSATLGGSTIDVTDTGTGTHSWSARRSSQALYSEIMDEADELVFMDDTVPMKYNTPTEYEIVNGWSFDSDGDLGYLYGGSIKVGVVDDMWANFYSIGVLEAGAGVFWNKNGSSEATHPGYVSGHIDQLIKTRAAGADIDTRNVTALVRTWTDVFTHNKLQAPTTGGRNPVALETANDSNNQTAEGTVATAPYSGITVTFDSPVADFDQNGTNENYTVTVDCNALTLDKVYERLKYITRKGETATINGVQGQFYKSANASFTEVKAAPFGTYAGGKFFGAQGILLTNYDAAEANNIILIDNTGATRQAPTSISVKMDSVISGDRCLMARSAFGTMTAVAATDLLTSVNHTLLVGSEISFSTTGTLPGPLAPDTIYYVISSGLTVDDFKVSATLSGAAIDITSTGTGTHSWTAPKLPRKNQFTIASTTSTTIVVTQAVANDIPLTGVIRVGDNRYVYTGLNRGTKTFTVSTNPTGESNGVNCFVPLIDEQATATSISKSLTYVADFAVVARGRKKGIIPFENMGNVTVSGLTVSVIRTTDTTVT